MKKVIAILAALTLLAGCASRAPNIVHPTAPQDALKSKYRKTQEVLLVNCAERTIFVKIYNGNYSNIRNVKEKETYSVVETTDTGERFEMFGCYGKPGDRFKISY